MEILYTVLFIAQILISVVMITLILIQYGKGADAGAAFGSGASATMFGSRGSGNFLTKTTTILAIAFLLNSLSLAYIASHESRNPKVDSLYQDLQQTTTPEENIPIDDNRTSEPIENLTSDIPKLPTD